MTIQPSSQLLIYQTPGGQTRLEVRLDDKRLQSPIQLFDYFDELLRRIQDIRTSENRFYQKITDIYASKNSLADERAKT